MIRAVLTVEDGSKTILMGLSAGNIDRLTNGSPILLKGKSVNMPEINILIVYGDTQAEVFAMLKQHFELPDGDQFHIEG